jgi:hypothetical protein
MVDAGLLVAAGEARGRTYSSGVMLKNLWKQTRQQFPYVAVDPFVEGPGELQKGSF